MAKKITIELAPESASLAYGIGLELNFTATHSDVLDHFSASEIISHFGEEVLLDSIGSESAANYFDLVEAE